MTLLADQRVIERGPRRTPLATPTTVPRANLLATTSRRMGALGFDYTLSLVAGHFSNSDSIMDRSTVPGESQNSDSDGTRSAETACPAPVPQDCQARAVRHRQEAVAHRPIRRENNG